MESPKRKKKFKLSSVSIQRLQNEVIEKLNFGGSGPLGLGKGVCNSSGEKNMEKTQDCHPATMTPIDLDMLRSLEQDYSAAAHQSNVKDKARRIWARGACLASVLFMFAFFTVGVTVFLHLADGDEEWTVIDTLLFAVYTTTSAGFGHISPPDTVGYYCVAMTTVGKQSVDGTPFFHTTSLSTIYSNSLQSFSPSFASRIW